MGNCADSRKTFKERSREGAYHMYLLKEGMKLAYKEQHQLAKNKYECARFEYQVKKEAEKRLFGPGATGASIKLQGDLLKFEKMLPPRYIHLDEFEKRTKKLVMGEDYVKRE